MHVRKIIRGRARSHWVCCDVIEWLTERTHVCHPIFCVQIAWTKIRCQPAAFSIFFSFPMSFPVLTVPTSFLARPWHMKILNPLVSFHQWRTTTPAFSSLCPISVHNSCVSDGEMRLLRLRRDPFLLASTETPVAISALGNFSLWASRGMV